MLRLEQLQPHGLDPIDLEIGAGECIAVQGASGSGKSLLLRAIADLDPCPGEAMLDGVSRSTMAGPAWRRRVMYVAAESGWWAERVGEHFEDWQSVVHRHGALGLSADCDGWPVQWLSTGERQRLALLRAIERDPSVLLLDEPTSGLDAAAIEAAEALLDGCRRDGMALIWVTHDPSQAARMATRQLNLIDGRAVAA